MATSTVSDKNKTYQGKTIIRPECRVCLKKDGILPVFGDKSKPDISMEISLFGGIQLLQTDDLPKFICVDCFNLLEGAISFRKLAKRTDSILKRRKKKRETLLVTHTSPLDTDVIETSLHPEYVEKMYQHVKFESNMKKIDFVSVKMDEHSESTTYFNNDELMINDVYEAQEDDIKTENDTAPTANTSVIKKTHSEHICKYCNLTFESSDSYEEHRNTVEHKKNYVMSFLPKKQKKGSSKTMKPKDHLCEICSTVFTEIQYRKHMLAEHKIKIENPRGQLKKQCTLCNKMFHRAALNPHMKRIHGVGKLDEMRKPKIKIECPICNKLFSKTFFPLHMERHKQGDSKNYICEQCGKKFFFKSSFFTHRLTHSNTLPHKCTYCPYRGRTKDLLKIHVRSHTGDYPYKCTQCDARCSTKSNLNSHMRRHRGPIDFICDTCNRGFYSKPELERHISVSHYGVKNHECPFCNASFGYRHGLMRHQRKVHKRPKGQGKPKAVYLQLEEEGLLPPEPRQEV